MPKEKLRESLDIALMLQKIIEKILVVLNRAAKKTPQLNDGLTQLFVDFSNFLFNIHKRLDEQVDLINERILIFGDGERAEKEIAVMLLGDEEPDEEPEELDDSGNGRCDFRIEEEEDE